MGERPAAHCHCRQLVLIRSAGRVAEHAQRQRGHVVGCEFVDRRNDSVGVAFAERRSRLPGLAALDAALLLHRNCFRLRDLEPLGDTVWLHGRDRDRVPVPLRCRGRLRRRTATRLRPNRRACYRTHHRRRQRREQHTFHRLLPNLKLEGPNLMWSTDRMQVLSKVSRRARAASARAHRHRAFADDDRGAADLDAGDLTARHADLHMNAARALHEDALQEHDVAYSWYAGI